MSEGTPVFVDDDLEEIPDDVIEVIMDPSTRERKVNRDLSGKNAEKTIEQRISDVWDTVDDLS